MSRTLLIIDDVGLNRKLLVKAIRKFQGKFLMDVVEAESGSDGLNNFMIHKPDVVICDIKLPDMSGFELYQRASKVHPEIPFIFITALSEKELKPQIEKYGINESQIFYKPLDFEQLRRAVYVLMKIDEN